MNKLSELSEKTARIEVIVKDEKNCPWYKKGDRIIFQDPLIMTNDSVPICAYAWAGLFPVIVAMARGASPHRLEINPDPATGMNVGYMACPDPGPPITNGGHVLFELRAVRTHTPQRVLPSWESLERRTE